MGEVMQVWEQRVYEKSPYLLLSFFLFFFSTAAPMAYESSQARGQIRTTAASLCHRHSNVGSELRLRPTP